MKHPSILHFLGQKSAIVFLAFFVFQISGVYSKAACQPDETKIVKISGIGMILVPGGSFAMGADKGRPEELPVHTVELSPFLIGATEITQSQYKALTNSNPSNYFGDDTLPVERVSWFDAVKFCNLLSTRAGLEQCYDETTGDCDFSKNGFRLPTEAEWEYACRAGTKTVYYFGDSASDIGDYAWFGNIEIGNCDNIPHPAGLKKPNRWGIFDMCGSNWEWCNDRYDAQYYASGIRQNPKGPAAGKLRVMRGGSWICNTEFMTSSYRECYVPSLSYLDIGFRVVKNGDGISR
ncbi:MAG: SUMF1/EgtB/PvdO family nonheme iron enzyme [Candidatus Latescibacterota bacterium]